MARTLLVTLAVTVEHLEGDDLELASEGAPEIEDDDGNPVTYPAGDDSDLDETSPSEIAMQIADHIVADDGEMWAGSGIYAKLTRASVKSADWQA